MLHDFFLPLTGTSVLITSWRDSTINKNLHIKLRMRQIEINSASMQSETFSLEANFVRIDVCRFSLSEGFIVFLFCGEVKIILRAMTMMPSLIKVMEVIMTGIITQLAMEAIISIAV